MPTGLPVYIRWLVYDPVTGALIANPLPNAGSWFETIYPQAGMPGTSAIGPFEISLASPGSDKAKFDQSIVTALKPYARCEAYLSTSPSDAAGAAGTPAYSGVITELPRDLNNYTIRGLDSLHLLQLQRCNPNEAFPQWTGQPGTAPDLLKYALRGYQLTIGDGQSRGGFTLGNFTNDGTWTTTTDDGFNAVLAGTGGDGLLYTTASYTNAQYADCAAEAVYHVKCNNAANAYAEAAVIAAAADANNFVLGTVSLRYINATRYIVRGEIWQKSGGTYSLKAQKDEFIILPTQDGRLQVRLTGFQVTATTYFWKLYINGADPGVQFVQTVGAGSPTGAAGLRSHKSGNAAAESAWCSQFSFWSKANFFQNGSIGATVMPSYTTQQFADTPMMDMLAVAQATEGVAWRKNPIAGLNNDTIDFNSSATSTDLTGSIRLEEGVNLQGSGLEPNADRPLTGLLATGTGSIDGSGVQHWYNFPAIDKYGLLIGTESFPHANDTLALRRLADQSLAFKATPDQAKRLQIVRTMDLVDTTKPLGLRFREGDTVLQRVPRHYIFDQKITIMSGRVVSGSPIVECTADQYPWRTDRIPALDRLAQALDSDKLRMSERTSMNSTLGGSMQRTLLLPSNPYKMRVYQVGAQTFGDNSSTKVTFDTVAFDTTISFSTANNNYIAPISGYYFVTAKVGVSTPANANTNCRWATYVYVNAASVAEGTIPYLSEAGALSHPTGANVFDLVYLNAGDTVDIRLTVANGGGNWTSRVATSDLTYWSMHLVSV